MKRYYLAYGSNLNMREMSHRCPKAKVKGTLELKDYRLVYKGSIDGYAYLTIEECKGYVVPLGLYEVSLLDIVTLDRYEGFPSLYFKKYIEIEIDGKLKKALIYVMNDQFSYHLPSVSYVETCKCGYENFGFNKDILDTALEDSIYNISKQNIKKFNK